jgi:anti-sigma factor RsiW
MSVCDEIRPEIPAFVSGGMDELQRNVVAGHLEICDACRREADEVRQLSALLSGAAVEHKPPEDLEEMVFGFIEHQHEADLVATAPLEHTPPDDLERRSFEHAGVISRTNRWLDRYAARLSPALALASILFFALGMNWRGDAQTFQDKIVRLEGHYGRWGQSMGVVDLAGSGDMSGAEVSAQLVDAQQENYRVVLYTEQLPPTPEGHHYAIWLVSEDARISCGSFQVDHPAKLSFPFYVGVNPMDYPELEITLEPNDGGPGPDGEVVMEAFLSSESLK